MTILRWSMLTMDAQTELPFAENLWLPPLPPLFFSFLVKPVAALNLASQASSYCMTGTYYYFSGNSSFVLSALPFFLFLFVCLFLPTSFSPILSKHKETSLTNTESDFYP